MKCIVVTGVLLALAAQMSAQEELVISVDESSLGSWSISAELLNPVSAIEATMANVSFELTGSGISGFQYNHFAFDSEVFGPANVTVTSESIAFRGINTPGPLRNAAGPDMSNPLLMVWFDAANISTINLVGQNDGAYLPTGTNEFPTIIFFQDSNGNPGDVPFRVEINPIPAPSSPALIAIVGAVVLRRRR